MLYEEGIHLVTDISRTDDPQVERSTLVDMSDMDHRPSMRTPHTALLPMSPGMYAHTRVPDQGRLFSDGGVLFAVAYPARVSEFDTEYRPLTRSTDGQDLGSERGKAHLSVP